MTITAPHIQAIHFVTGLGKLEGKPLSDDQLLAIDLAAAMHPKAEVFLHTHQGSCQNYNKANTRRVWWYPSSYDNWPTWQIEHGAHMSDKLRLDVLLAPNSYQHQLYLDTDAFCMQNLDFLACIEGTAMARLSAFSIANGLIYQGPDKNYLNSLYWAMGDSAGDGKNVSGSRLPAIVAKEQAGLTVLDSAVFHGASGDEAFHDFWNQPADHVAFDAKTRGAKVLHVISSGTGQQWSKYQQGTNGELALLAARDKLAEVLWKTTN